MLPLGSVETPPPFSCGCYHPGSSEKIERHLPEHGIKGILNQSREPGPKGVVVEMRDSKILLHNIADF